MLNFVTTRYLSVILPCILSIALFSCSTSKNTSPRGVLNIEFHELDFEINQKSDENLIEYMIYFSEENGYNQFRDEIRRLNLLVPTTFTESAFLESEEALSAFGEKAVNGALIYKTANNYEALIDAVGKFGIIYTPEFYESNGLYFEDGTHAFLIVEDMPELIGGLENLRNEIIYPEAARENSAEGRVIIQFVVTKDGSVRDARVAQGVSNELNEEALRVVKNANFNPGLHRGEPVEVRYSLPVVFRLTSNSN